MRRLTRFLTRLYPAAWRKRYEAELDALLEDVKPGWRPLLDILRGAVVMQLRAGSFWRIVAISGLAGLLIGLRYRLECRSDMSRNPAFGWSPRTRASSTN